MELDDGIPGEGVGVMDLGEDELGVGCCEVDGRRVGELAGGEKKTACDKGIGYEGSADQLGVDLEDLRDGSGILEEGEECVLGEKLGERSGSHSFEREKPLGVVGKKAQFT